MIVDAADFYSTCAGIFHGWQEWRVEARECPVCSTHIRVHFISGIHVGSSNIVTVVDPVGSVDIAPGKSIALIVPAALLR